MGSVLSTEEWQAAKVRADLGYGDTEPIDLERVLMKENIITMFREMSDTACGLSVKSANGRKFMLINCKMSLARQNYTIAHELYHLYVDEDPKPHLCVKGGKAPTEKKADAFASALLMPSKGVLGLIPMNEAKNLSLATVMKIEQYFAVSHKAVLIRLKRLDLLTEQELQSFSACNVHDVAKTFGYSQDLYNPANNHRIIGDYQEKAWRLYDGERISESHYLELLKSIK